MAVAVGHGRWRALPSPHDWSYTALKSGVGTFTTASGRTRGYRLDLELKATVADAAREALCARAADRVDRERQRAVADLGPYARVEIGAVVPLSSR
jgi:hypothetical protein